MYMDVAVEEMEKLVINLYVDVEDMLEENLHSITIMMVSLEILKQRFGLVGNLLRYTGNLEPNTEEVMLIGCAKCIIEKFGK